jgi:hypothetical protein
MRSLFEYSFDAIALLLPALDRFTQTQWIAADGFEWAVLVPICVQALVYTAVLLGASLIDFYRREL